MAAPVWAEVLLWVGAVAAALTAIVVLIGKTGRGMKTIGVWMGDIVRDIVRDELRPLRDQLEPNGGASLHDKVTRIETWARQHDPEGWGHDG